MDAPQTTEAYNAQRTGRVTLAERVTNFYRSEDKLQKKKIRRGKTNWQSRNTR
jgi:hypothetical protein